MRRPSSFDFILASSSPRRRALLQSAGFDFRSLHPDVDEEVRIGEHPRALVKRLSQAKARRALDQLQQETDQFFGVILAADTIVCVRIPRPLQTPKRDWHILNKPQSPSDHRRMLRLLSGQDHEVLSGYCILGSLPGGATRSLIRVVRTKVRMAPLSERVIRHYAQDPEGRDKSGGYSAQGVGSLWMEETRGSWTNILGLPIAQVVADLRREFRAILPPTFFSRCVM